MRRRFQLLGLATLLLCATALDARAADTKAKLWVADVQDVEEMIALSLETGDADELKAQEYRIAKLMWAGVTGNGDALESLPEAYRLTCVMAAQALYNFIDATRKTPAKALKLMKMDSATYHENMPQCEKAAKVPGKRHLPM